MSIFTQGSLSRCSNSAHSRLSTSLDFTDHHIASTSIIRLRIERGKSAKTLVHRTTLEKRRKKEFQKKDREAEACPEIDRSSPRIRLLSSDSVIGQPSQWLQARRLHWSRQCCALRMVGISDAWTSDDD